MGEFAAAMAAAGAGQTAKAVQGGGQAARQQPNAYIHSIPDAEASGDVADWYNRARNADGSLDNVASIHGLNPASGHAHWALYLQAMKGESPLSLAERELVGVACAVSNRCGY